MPRLMLAIIALSILSLPVGAEEPTKPLSPFDAPFAVPRMTAPRTDAAPFKFRDVGKKIPNYTPGEKWGVQGEPRSQMQEPLPPEEAVKHLVVPEGFRVELFAADPDIGGKPIAMTWDERGRLWIAETYDYPNELQPPEQGRDRIRICEDTDGDGRADKFTVFAEKLSIPTSMAFSRGGVIVFDATQTVFLQDTDGDDVADRRSVLFGTWAQGDTHGGPSNMQYGLDNWIWGVQGYNDSRLTIGGREHRFRQGFYRFRPDGSQLEFLRSTDNNTWGLGISEEGIAFGSTANRNPSVHLGIPNRYYERVRGWTPSLMAESLAATHLFQAASEKIRQMDHFGGYTAGCGHALYTVRRYPREYWNRTAFVCEPTGHLVGTFVISRTGSGFRDVNSFNLLAGDDEWSAPIMAEVGPDGNVWVLDWYNYIVQHNPTPRGFKTGKGNAYETDLRDKKHGRVYRVVYQGAEADRTGFTLAGASPEKLVETLAHDNLFWRRHAQRLLVERGQTDVVPQLVALVSNQSADAIGLNVGAIHALWTLHGLNALDGGSETATAAAVAALKHPSAGVRRNAVQVLPLEAKSAEALLAAGVLADPDPQVRLMALLALADRPVAGSGEALVKVLIDPANAADRWIPEAAIAAAASASEPFIAALAEAKVVTPKLLDAAAIVAEHRVRSGPSDSIAWLVDPLPKMPVPLAEAVTRGVRGWPSGQPPRLDDETERKLTGLLARLGLEGRANLIGVGVRWQSQALEAYADELSAALLARACDAALDAPQRLDAARELMALRATNAVTANLLLDQITPRMEPELARGMLRAVAVSTADANGASLAKRLPAWTPGVRAAGIAVLLSRPAWTGALLDALSGGTIQLSDLSLDERRALADHPERSVRERARRLLAQSGALPNADRRKVLEELLPLAKQSGDVARGKAVFAKQCAKCHVHGDEGTRIGPDLTGMAVHPKEELLEALIDPSRSVEGNFRVYTLSTADGLVLTGLLAAESKTAVELFDAEGKKHQVLREDIEALTASNKSLMPEGFEKQVSQEELVDLLAFLAARGKFLPLPLEKAATVVSTRGIFIDPASPVERLVFDDWKPKTFAGVPFQLVDPRGDRIPNAVLLYAPQGDCAKFPKSVSLPCHAPARRIHLLGGISGWGYPGGEKGSVSLIVRLHYADGAAEDHELRNGEHFADYIRRVDVPRSQFAFDLHGRQLRYLNVEPKRTDPIERIELVKGPDSTAPVVMAVTLEAP